MRRLLTLLTIMSTSWTLASTQTSYLDRPDLLEQAGKCLKQTYAFSFPEARSIQEDLQEATPGHPAPSFLKALIVYWENFPLAPGTDPGEEFILLMDRVIDMSQALREDSLTYTEGVFFDLFGRAFKAMFWADNGKAGKVIPDLGNMYRYTKKGFELKDQFTEFYFSTGLYNYYIEAYPEAHPSYKPLVAFMHKGDREQGLKELNHAISHAVFLKVESLLFMSIIQLKYENDLNSASIYAEKLVGNYPENIFYQGHLITILLYQQRYEKVRQLLAATAEQKDNYSSMIRSLAAAFMAEKEIGDVHLARTAYMETIALADGFGPFADTYGAIGYMGMSRLSERQGFHKEASSYARKASRLTSYSFILEN